MSQLPVLPADQEAALLDAIHADPESDQLRLVFADFLEDHGDARAELIRIQCALLQPRLSQPRFLDWRRQEDSWRKQYKGVWWDEAPEGMSVGWDRGLAVVLLPAGRFFNGLPEWLTRVVAGGWACPLTLTAESPLHARRLASSKLAAWGLQALPGLRTLDLSGSALTDDSLLCLTRLSRLQHLHLHGSRDITDAGIKHLKGLTQLRSLSLSWTGITDVGLKHLQCLEMLQSLRLWNNPMLAAGLKYLRDLEQLRELNLNDFHLDSKGMNYLKQMTGLQALHLAGTWTSDAELAQLRSLKGLRLLDLEDTTVTDAGLKHLEALTELETLRLPSQTTDVGLVHLRRLGKLRRLDLTRADVTEAALRRLRENLPQLQRIERSGEPM